MVKTWYFSGTVNWAKPDVVSKFGKYTLDLYLDSESQKKYIDSKLRLKDRADKEGAAFITLSRAESTTSMKGVTKAWGPIPVLDKDGQPFAGKIGNGSSVTVKVDVYDTTTGTKGHRVTGLRVDNLVPFGGEVEVDTDIEQPF